MKILVVLATAMLVASAAAASDEHCLAEAMYFEARNQGGRGLLAVGIVVQNRV